MSHHQKAQAGDLLTVIDFSKKVKKIYCMTAFPWSRLEELKKRSSSLKHVSELKNKVKRKTYIAKLPKRFRELRNYLVEVRIRDNAKDLEMDIKRVLPSSRVIIVDDSLLLKKFAFLQDLDKVLPESIAKRRSIFRTPLLITDNLAYYSRILIESLGNLNEALKVLRKKGIL